LQSVSLGRGLARFPLEYASISVAEFPVARLALGPLPHCRSWRAGRIFLVEKSALRATGEGNGKDATACSILLFTKAEKPSGISPKKIAPCTMSKWQLLNRNRSRTAPS
jgi:hypothetical protein